MKASNRKSSRLQDVRNHERRLRRWLRLAVFAACLIVICLILLFLLGAF